MFDWMDNIFPHWSNGKSDEEVARYVLKEFYYVARPHYESMTNLPYKYSFEDVVKVYKDKKQLSWIANGIRMAKISKGDIQDAVKVLANQGGGKLPTHAQDFINAIQGEATSNSFIDFGAKVQTAVEKTSEISLDIIESGAGLAVNLKKYTPIIVGTGAIIAVAYLLSQVNKAKRTFS